MRLGLALLALAACSAPPDDRCIGQATPVVVRVDAGVPQDGGFLEAGFCDRACRDVKYLCDGLCTSYTNGCDAAGSDSVRCVGSCVAP